MFDSKYNALLALLSLLLTFFCLIWRKFLFHYIRLNYICVP